MPKYSPSNKTVLQLGFYSFCAIIIALVVNQTAKNNSSYDIRSKASSSTPIISNLKAYTTADRTVAYVTWTTNKPTTSFVAYDNTDAYMFSNDPLQWGRGWRVNVDNTSFSAMKTSHMVRIGSLNDLNADYFFRVAGRDIPQGGNLAIAVAPVLLKRPNCCGYNTAFNTWYCYTNCKPANASSVTTLYPSNVCTVASQCTQ